jgi:predicted Zn-dependent protease
MAALLCRLGRCAEGLTEYQAILRQGFQSADMLAQMGRAALALGQPDEALQYLERARYQNPEYVLTYYYLGQAYRRKGLRNKARSAWRRYLNGAADWHPRLAEEDLDFDEQDP